MQDARAAGYRTAAEAYKYIEEKRKKEAEESAKRINVNSQAVPGGKVQQSPRDVSLASSTTSVPIVLDRWDVNGLPGADLLSEAVRTLTILQAHYYLFENLLMILAQLDF